MRVAFNALAALKPKTGVGHHVAELLAALRIEHPADTFDAYPGGTLSRVIAHFQRRPPSPPQPRNASTLTSVKGLLKSAAKAGSGLHFTAYTRTFSYDLYHEPNFVPFRSPLPTVVTVHDLSVIKFPQWHPADRVRSHTKHFTRGLTQAAHVITVSEAVRQEVIETYDLPADRVTAVHNGISSAFQPLSSEIVEPVRLRLGLPTRYLLCVGTIEPRKNLGTVIRAFADLTAAMREACPLVLVGPWGWRADGDRELFETVGQSAGVRHLGYVADADLPAVYNGATALLYPSFYEGFGLPPVEMLACGGAVVASDIPVLREVCGPYATFVAPEDIVGWREAMRATVGGARPSGGIGHAARFTWNAAARSTMEVYRTVVGQSSDIAMSPRTAAEQVDVRDSVKQTM